MLGPEASFELRDRLVTRTGRARLRRCRRFLGKTAPRRENARSEAAEKARMERDEIRALPAGSHAV